MLFSTNILTLAMLANAAVAAAPAPAPAEDPLNKIVCRRILETGSLVKGERVCLTRREWALASEKGRDRATEMQTLINTQQGN